MKNLKNILLGVLILAGLQFGLTGCVAEVGGRGHSGGGPWFHDGPWMDGGRGRGIDIHPPGFRR